MHRVFQWSHERSRHWLSLSSHRIMELQTSLRCLAFTRGRIISLSALIVKHCIVFILFSVVSVHLNEWGPVLWLLVRTQLLSVHSHEVLLLGLSPRRALQIRNALSHLGSSFFGSCPYGVMHAHRSAWKRNLRILFVNVEWSRSGREKFPTDRQCFWS
jgi:hypothetical protein